MNGARGFLVCFLMAAATTANAQQSLTPSQNIDVHQFKSKIFDNTRAIRVLLPPGYRDPANVSRRYPVLYMNDGIMVFRRLNLEETVHSLISDGKIAPVVIVGIDNGGSTDKTVNAGRDRTNEYLPYPDVGFAAKSYKADPPEPNGKLFPSFLDEVMAFVESKYRVRRDRAIGGMSYGGVAALYAVMQRPGSFDGLLLESTPLWIGPDKQLLREAGSFRKWPSSVYVGLGENESPEGVVNSEGKADIAALAEVLKRNAPKAKLKINIDPEGKHESASWSKRLPDALQFLFPPHRQITFPTPVS
jgi:predicted alpha/beta superfamily hydrolase